MIKSGFIVCSVDGSNPNYRTLTGSDCIYDECSTKIYPTLSEAEKECSKSDCIYAIVLVKGSEEKDSEEE